MRKQKEVEIDGEQFVVHELKVSDMLQIMPRLTKEDQAAEATLDLMKLCVYQDGGPLGDEIGELGLSAYMKLSEYVLEINGLAGNV